MTDALAAAAGIHKLDSRRRAIFCAIAIGLHVGLLGAFAASWHHDPIGTAGQNLDAISVEVAIVPSIGVVGSPSLAPSDDAPPSSPAAPPEQRRQPDAAKPDPAPADPETEALAVAEPKPVVSKPKPDPAEARPDPEREVDKPTERERPKPASAESAVPAIAAAPAAAAPSKGEVQAYARSIVAALSASRPRSAPGSVRGTVRIAFSIADNGQVDSLRIVRSSGHAALDEAALAAVRRAKFGPPPPGMTVAERTYEIPYHFR